MKLYFVYATNHGLDGAFVLAKDEDNAIYQYKMKMRPKYFLFSTVLITEDVTQPFVSEKLMSYI